MQIQKAALIQNTRFSGSAVWLLLTVNRHQQVSESTQSCLVEKQSTKLCPTDLGYRTSLLFTSHWQSENWMPCS